jgi:hypothetical protein
LLCCISLPRGNGIYGESVIAFTWYEYKEIVGVVIVFVNAVFSLQMWEVALYANGVSAVIIFALFARDFFENYFNYMQNRV